MSQSTTQHTTNHPYEKCSRRASTQPCQHEPSCHNCVSTSCRERHWYNSDHYHTRTAPSPYSLMTNGSFRMTNLFGFLPARSPELLAFQTRTFCITIRPNPFHPEPFLPHPSPWPSRSAQLSYLLASTHSQRQPHQRSKSSCALSRIHKHL